MTTGKCGLFLIGLIVACAVFSASATRGQWDEPEPPTTGIRGEDAELEDEDVELADGFTRAFSSHTRAIDDGGGKESLSPFQLMDKFLPSSSFSVRTSSAPRDSSGLIGVFVKDDLASIIVESERDGYLYLFYLLADGNLRRLYPYNADTDNSIKRNARKEVPSPTDAHQIRVDAPFGTEHVLALVTTAKLSNATLRTLNLTSPLARISPSNFTDFLEATSREAARGALKYGIGRARIDTFPNSEEAAEYLSSDRVYFVGVGINEYVDDKIARLSACVNDCRRLRDALMKFGCVENSRSILITNREATRARVEFLFNSYLPDETRPGDLVIVYWSGHGAMASLVDEKVEEEESDAVAADGALEFFLVPYDAEGGKVETMIPTERMNSWVDRLAGRRVLFILDCCYSGRAIDQKFPWRNFGIGSVRAFGRPDCGVISSCSPDQTSPTFYRPGIGSLSVMTSELVEELENRVAAAAGDEISLSVEEFAKSVADRTATLELSRAENESEKRDADIKGSDKIDDSTVRPHYAFSFDPALTIKLRKPKESSSSQE